MSYSSDSSPFSSDDKSDADDVDEAVKAIPLPGVAANTSSSATPTLLRRHQPCSVMLFWPLSATPPHLFSYAPRLSCILPQQEG
eukprot:2792334-Pleurochrysis_carterae.AAC.1